MDPYQIVFHPSVTEKTMMIMDRNNALEFIVRRTATKPQIKEAIQTLFDCEVKAVNTRITGEGKRAIVYLGDDDSAEDIGMRIGVF